MNKTALSLIILPLLAAPSVSAEPASAPAAPVPSPIRPDADACTALDNDARRLACYDQAHGRAEPAAPKTVDLSASTQASIDQKSPQVVFAPQEHQHPVQYTALSQLYDLDENHPSGLFTVREHNPMYLMPAWYRTSPNRFPASPTRNAISEEAQTEQRRLETKMQISFKTKLLEDLFKSRADVWFGYTQQSNWQIYNQGRKSAPFRNSDYSPEIFITQPVQAKLPFGGRLRMLGAGFVHQSNGRSRPLSRSWNRLYAFAGMEWEKLSIIPRVWFRLDPSGDKDDNPDISKYMGYGDLKLAYRFDNKHSITSQLRYNPKHGKGAIELNYIFPITGKLKGFVQGFYGYGESLIDYNHRQKAIGFGIMFKDWEGL